MRVDRNEPLEAALARGIGEAPVPPGLAGRALAAVRAAEGGAARDARPPAPREARFLPVAAAAAIVLAVVGTGFGAALFGGDDALGLPSVSLADATALLARGGDGGEHLPVLPVAVPADCAAGAAVAGGALFLAGALGGSGRGRRRGRGAA